jgi:hypothetical protein
MANLAIGAVIFTRAAGIAGGCSAKLIQPYIKKEGKVYSLVGASDKIRALSDKCSVQFRMAEAELWQKIYEYHESYSSGDPSYKAKATPFAEAAVNFSPESVVRVCQVLKDCIDLHSDLNTKSQLQEALQSAMSILRIG